MTKEYSTPGRLTARTPRPAGALTRMGARWGLAGGLLAAALFGRGPTATAQPVPEGRNLVTYLSATTGRQVRLTQVHRLPTGQWLVSGQTSDLSWLPQGPGGPQIVQLTVPQTPSSSNPAVPGINSRSRSIGFIMRLSEDMTRVEALVHMPPGLVRDITKLRYTGVPGDVNAGTLYISGNRDLATPVTGNNQTDNSGYFIARLNNNFVSGVPSAIEWTFDVQARPQIRNNRTSGPYPGGKDSETKLLQPWDVDAQGRVVFVSGREISDDFAQMQRLTAMGKPDTVRHWPVQHVYYRRPTQFWDASDTINNGVRTAEWLINRAAGYPRPGVDSVRVRVATNPDVFATILVDSVRNSSIVLKTNRGGSNLRSYSLADYNRVSNDENGNPGRQGAYPDDYYYSAPCLDGQCPPTQGPGYTNYFLELSGNNTATQRCVAVTIDRRDGGLYFGYSTQSRHGVNIRDHDFEPALVAMTPSGRIRWWARMYRETPQGSPANQFVDDIKIDYTRDELVVLGRTRGNSAINFWRSTDLIAGGPQGFQNAWRDTNDVETVVSWLGRYGLAAGNITRATYVGEYDRGASLAVDTSLRQTGGLPLPNLTDAPLASTACGALSVTPDGRVALACSTESARTMTTRDAYQRGFLPDRDAIRDSLVSTSTFVRIYSADLDSIIYSSGLGQQLDPQTSSEPRRLTLFSTYLHEDSLYVAGYQDSTGSQGVGSVVATVNTPEYGANNPAVGGAGLLARLTRGCAAPEPVTVFSIPQVICRDSLFIVAAQGAGSGPGARLLYQLSGPGFQVVAQRGDTLVGRVGAGTGRIRVSRVNGCGTSTPIVRSLPTPSVAPMQPVLTFDRDTVYGQRPPNPTVTVEWLVDGQLVTSPLEDRFPAAGVPVTSCIQQRFSNACGTILSACQAPLSVGGARAAAWVGLRPVPAGPRLEVSYRSLRGARAHTLRIFDALGRPCLTHALPTPAVEGGAVLSIDHLPAGVYRLIVELTDSRRQAQTFVRE